MTKARKRDSIGEHVYLKDRIDNWYANLELAILLCAIGLALLAAAYSPDGFWRGLLDALKQLLNRI